MQRKWRRRWEQHKTSFSTHSISSSVIKAAAKCVLPPLVAAGILLSTAGPAFALPTDVVIVNGTATITQTNDTMNVNQGSRKLIVNSDTFVINSNETLNLNQGLQDVALWKVTGGDPTAIYGQVNASGGLFLINESGTLFSKGSQVNVGSLVTSSLNITDSDFLAGNYKFSGKDNNGAVVNQGTITARNGGYIALMGPQVRNEGILVARQGTVALGAGKAVTLDMNGDGLLNLAVNAAAVNASVANHQLIQADGGQVIMTGRAAKDLAGTVVNNSGIIQARSINNTNGVIRLDGGAHGTVVNSGTLDASGKEAGQTGGTVKVLGDNVQLANGTNIDVSGYTGGGTALIGGNYQGKGPEQNTKSTTVEKGATITADALEKGNGGTVVVWANDTTKFNGTISARGGVNGGNGGQVETSGHQTLELGDAARVVTLAPKGKTGNWLLDPEDYTIGTGTTGTNYWNNVELGNALNSSNITVQTATTGSGNGDINVDARIDWSSPTTLTLSAYRDININEHIVGTGGGNLTLRADNTGLGNGSNGNTDPGLGAGHGTVKFSDPLLNGYKTGDYAISLTGGNGTGNNITIYYDPVDGFNTNGTSMWGGGAATNSFHITSISGSPRDWWVNPWSSIEASTAPDAVYGSGPVAKFQGNTRAYMLVNSLSDLSNAGKAGGYDIGGLFYLSQDIDASPTRNWSYSAYVQEKGGNVLLPGFQPINLSSGIFDGGGHTIDNLYVTGAGATGLFSALNKGSVVRDLGLTNLDVTGFATQGQGNVGGLAGSAWGATIDNVYVTGKVTGDGVNYVGGLVGQIMGYDSTTSITDSYNLATVTASGDPVFRESYPGIVIIPSLSIGGLVGGMDIGSVSNGNAGYTPSLRIDNSYNGGDVTVNAGRGSATIYAGGLVGRLASGNLFSGPADSRVSRSYNTGDVTVNSGGNVKAVVHAGGFVGDNSKAAISQVYSIGRVRYDGDQTYVGGVAGSNSGTITQSYWDKEKSGQTKGIGSDTGTGTNLAGLTTAQMVAQNSFSGWDFTRDWYMIDGYTMPFLRSEYSTRISTPHQLQLMALNPAAHYTLVADLDLRSYRMAPGVGFVPVDNFSGSFDGQGHTISWLNIHDYGATDAIGLFANTGSGAAIHDVALANANVVGTTANQHVGILAGSNAGTIYNTYSGGTVSGDGNVGGSAGTNTGNISTSFSSAKVTGSGSAGGLVGDNTGTISESYLDEAGSVNGSVGGPLVGSDSGTVTAPTYSGANWVNLGGNHYLAWTVAPDGTIGLYTPAQLQAIQNHLAGSYRLRADLDLAGRNWTAIGTAVDPFTGKLNGGSYSIDNLTIADSPLNAIGLFGYTQGAELSNLTLNNVNIAGTAGNSYVGGLVGYADGGSISNVAVNGTVTAAGDSSYAGGLVGYGNGSLALAGVAIAAKVTADGANSTVGGLAGYNGGTITNSYNAGDITANGVSSSAGGLAGENAGSITGGDTASFYGAAYNTGTVKTTQANSYAGGLAGKNSGSIVSAYNNGAVITEGDASHAGGVAGVNAVIDGRSGSITSAYNTGAVTTKGIESYAGGLAGLNSGSISGVRYFDSNTYTWVTSPSYNTGTVTAENDGSYAGGVAGENSGSISMAYADATVTAKGADSHIGGIAGANAADGSIANAYFGSYTGTAHLNSTGARSHVGGIAGDNAGSIADVFSFGVIDSSGPESYVGGLVGDNSGSIATSLTLGAVKATGSKAAGVLAGKNSGSIAASVFGNTRSAFNLDQAPAVGDGTGGTLLTYDQMLTQPDTWQAFGSNWNLPNDWSIQFPRLTWQTAAGYTAYGRVLDGGPGVTVNQYTSGGSYYDPELVETVYYNNKATGVSFGADGLYFIEAGSPNGLFTVSGQAYKANSIYTGLYSNQVNFSDLAPDTLMLMGNVDYDGWGWSPLNFRNVFASDVYAPGDTKVAALMVALREQNPELMFTVSQTDKNTLYNWFRQYDLKVEGNFVAKNFEWYLAQDRYTGDDYTRMFGNITTKKTAYADGSLMIDNSALAPVNRFLASVPPVGISASFSAAGDITLKESGSLIIQQNLAGSSGPRLSAGGDVNITAGGMFVNWAGPNAIQADGRTLVYAKDMLITSADMDLFYKSRIIDPAYITGLLYTSSGDSEIYDTRGGLGGFVLWGTASGDPVPTSGSGFIYTAGDPKATPRSWMTPAWLAGQTMRELAASTAQAGNAIWPGAAVDSATPDVRDSILEPHIVDGGVALPVDTDEENGEEK